MIIQDCVLDIASQYGGAAPGLVTTSDKSRYHNNGMLHNVTWAQLGDGLWVMEFNGTTSYMETASVVLIEELWHEGTYLAWIYPLDVANNGIIGGNAFTSNVRILAGVLNYRTSSAGGHNISGTVAVVANAWQFVVVTFQDNTIAGANNIKLYIDGVGETVSLNQAIPAVNRTLLVGAQDDAPVTVFEGYIGYAKAYNYVWTPAQIRARSHATKWMFGSPL